MKRTFLALFLTLAAGTGFAQTPPPIPDAAPKAPTQFVAQGERVEIPEAGFSIVPPVGWEVRRDSGGASLVILGPKPVEIPGEYSYQPNLRVMTFQGAKPMDDATKDEFQKVIEENSAKLSNRITQFSTRSVEKIKLQNGIDAFLYYTEYMFDAAPQMQMHILVSSGTQHFLMTYTDLSKEFEKEGAPNLTTAYTSMHSVELPTVAPDRFRDYIYIGGGVGALLIFLLFVRIVRGYRMKKLGERIEAEDVGETDGSGDDVSGIAELSDDDDYETPRSEVMPATDVAPPKPAKPSKPIKVEKPAAPIVAKAAPQKPAAPAPAPAPVRAPAPAPAPAKFEGRKRKDTSEHESDVNPLSGAWNVNEDADDQPQSYVSEVSQVQASITTTKAKHQKTQPPSKRREEPVSEVQDMGGEVSEVALISDVLPNTGEKKKKKGFFGFGGGEKKAKAGKSKKVEELDDELDEEMAEEMPIKTAASRGKGKTQAISTTQPVSQVSEIAGWNLEGESGEIEDDEEDS